MNVKRVLWVFGGVSTVAGGSLSLSAYQFVPLIAPGTMVGSVSVGGLTPEDARKRVRAWWDATRRETVALETVEGANLPKQAMWAELGLTVNDQATIDQIQLETFWQATSRTLLAQSTATAFPIVFGFNPDRLKRFDDAVRAGSKDLKPAKAQWDGKRVWHRTEVAPMMLDLDSMPEIVTEAFETQAQAIALPITTGPKRVPDEELRRIVNVMATFQTRFPASNVPRSSNIRLASSLLDGMVLMPGETFSFNETLGPRTTAKGYRVAGVFVNGRLDEGVGGGICQVSTTLYNAAALADLKIVQRSNHSLAVPYVPIGRDAAVSYPSLDLKFTNNQEFPVAIDSVYERGRVTFRILGVDDPSITVSIERGRLQSWSRGTKVQHDGTLPFGRTRLVDKGGTAHKTTTYRVVRQGNKVLRREVLAVSQYPGSPRLVARNLRAAPPTPAGPPAPPALPLPPIQP